MFSVMIRWVLFFAIYLPIAAVASAQQSFDANIDGAGWRSDHDGITVIPVIIGNGSVTILATSKGHSSFPPPKGFPDQFSIVCPLPKQATRFDAGIATKKSCAITFTRAMRNATHADFKTTRNEGVFESEASAKGFVNFTRVTGKEIEATFEANLVDAKTKRRLQVTGKFKGVDEQVGSKGFN
jgi:hypothetical protein